MHLSLNNSLGKWILPTTAPFSPEALNYFSRLDAAGDTTYVDYKQPLANYIDSLVTLGGAYWDDMGSAASFVGVGIQGVTVPLKSTMSTLTNNNFVAGDLDPLTGLKGDASTKYLDTSVKFNDFPQNDFSMSANITEHIPESTNGPFLIYNSFGDGVSQISTQNDSGVNPNNLVVRCNTRNAVFLTDLGGLEDFYGINRTLSTGYSVQYGASSTTVTQTSQAPANQIISIFGASTQLKVNARMATYHIGPALNLPTLRGLQATLLSEIRTAHTFVAAASYFSRLAAAGDTTHVAYKQPLTNYITSLVELGGAYWDDMKSSASFVGVGIQGITVPLRAGMASITNVNNNFVAGDLDQLTGLKGDGVTKYLGTGVNEGSLSQNDSSISVYLTTDRDVITTSSYIGGTIQVFAIVDNATGFRSRHMSSSLKTNGTSTAVGGIIGISRDNSSDYDWRDVDANGTNIDPSTNQSNNDVEVFASNGGGFLCSARLATYHAGPALDLATLEGLQATLITEIAAI